MNTSVVTTHASHGFSVNNHNSRQRRDTRHVQHIDTQISDSSQVNVLLQGAGSQGSSCANHLLGTQGSVYNSLYSSPGFNAAFSGFESNIQWLTDNRLPSVPNNQALSDKNLSCNSGSVATVTSAPSCCVNRLGPLDSVAMCSPLSSDSYKIGRDTSFQSKPNISMNMIDSVQSWYNFQIPAQQVNSTNNQHFGKYSDLPQNCHIALQSTNTPVMEHAELKQSDMCLQMTDTSFENMNSNKQSQSTLSNPKHPPYLGDPKFTDQDDTAVSKQSASVGYQTNSLSREWKQPVQNNYMPSPTFFASMSDSPDHYLYSQFSLPSASSYYMSSETNVNSNNKIQQSYLQEKQSNSTSSKLSCLEQSTIQYHYSVSRSVSEENNKFHTKIQTANGKSCSNHLLSDCCEIAKAIGKQPDTDVSQNFHAEYLNNSNCVSNTTLLYTTPNIDADVVHINGDTKLTDISSESEESNIIVEESDEMEEIENELSIEDIKKSLLTTDSCTENAVLLRCLVCNVSSTQTPASQFIHMNDSFPLMSASRTPVVSKLVQILPVDLQRYLKIHNSFMCRRCLQLVETVEVLEVKLTTVKRTLGDNFSKTVEYYLSTIQNSAGNTENNVDSKVMQVNEKCGAQTAENIKVDMTEEKDTTVQNTEAKESEVKETDAGNPDDKTEKETYRCDVCTKVLSTPDTYKSHFQLHTKQFRFYCDRCGKGYPLKYTLEKHLQSHEKDIKYQCEKCGKTYTDQNVLKDHIRKHVGDYRFTCNECNKGFMNKTALERHLRTHTGEKPYVCEHCGKRFASDRYLIIHIKICSENLMFKCDDCDKGFALQALLDRHKLQHKGAYKEPCTVCGQGFMKPVDLKAHMRSHSTDKEYECKVCGKKYKSVSNLNQHAKVHETTKLLKCSICGESFIRQSVFKDHMNKHTGYKPYKCEFCDKMFSFKRMYILHKKEHTGNIKLRACDICGKSFRHGLSVHMRSHSGEKPYSCSYCPKAFSVSSTLKKHVAKKHSVH